MLWAIIVAESVAVAAPSGDSLFTGGGADAVVLRGYVEARGTFSDADETHWGATERLRPTMKVYLWDRITATATFEARLDQGRYDTGEFLEAFRGPIESSLRDLSGNGPSLEEVIETCEWDIELERTYDQVSDVLSTERLFLDVNLPVADFRVGRQSVNWGSALFLNPSDIFQQVLIAEPWQERAGIDAARVNVPLGDRARVTALVGALDSFTRYRGAVKGTVNVKQTDISALVSSDGSRHYGGIDLKGDLSGPVPLGWWFEGIYQLDTDEDTPEGAPKAAVGADYSFDLLNRLYVAGQVYYDGTGEIPALYDWNSRQDPALAGITPCETYDDLPSFEPPDEYRLTLGQWYALNILQLEATDNLTLTNTAVINLADQTGLLFPTAAYIIGSRVTLNGGVQYLFGSDGEFSPPDYQLLAAGGEVDLAPLQPTVTGLAWVRVNL
ncbi:MAG: hypothetical protein ACI8S6_001458 [Myxococcota bacterium]|jgi:hypothetical protein